MKLLSNSILKEDVYTVQTRLSIARLLAACNLPRVCVYNSDYVLSAMCYAKMSDIRHV